MKYFIIKFSGSFGFIKPWTAVRDSKIKSEFYLTPSILMGIERKLFPELLLNDNGKLNKIVIYRLSFSNISFQKELTKSINYERKTDNETKEKYFKANTSTVERGILINPDLYLFFTNKEDANITMTQHICLCRNEDILLPVKEDKDNKFPLILDKNDFDLNPEFIFGMKLQKITPLFNFDLHFKNNQIRFFTQSPVLLKEHSKVSKFTKYYTFKDVDSITSQMMKRVVIKKANDLNKQFDENDFDVFFDQQYLKKKVKSIQINGIHNKASACPVIVETKNPEIAKFIYDVGIGHSTGCGFGFLL